MIEAKKLDESNVEITFNIQPLADRLGISKEKLDEKLADEFMKILGIL